jgi:channel protein (hemolysin III family)
VIAAAVGVGGLLLLLAGGMLYSLGALTYAMRRPALAPSWFGYHELFHALVIGANALSLRSWWWRWCTTEVARQAGGDCSKRLTVAW